jgi:V/A-type H+-transporting ATPase subunit I
MLRPEKMARVSVTGAKRYMAPVTEAVHEQHRLHVSEYDGSFEGFDPGDPVEGAEDDSEKLVQVRSIKSQLGIDEDADGGGVDLDGYEERLEEIRQSVNELDDERDAIETELREIEAEIEAAEPFAELGIDLDLLGGYDSLQVAVGEGRRRDVEDAVVDADDLGPFEVFPRDADAGVLAVFARTDEETPDDALDDVLVGTEFTAIEVPDAEGSPAEYVGDLESRREELESELASVRERLDAIEAREREFLLTVEELLSIRVQKAEAPLSFATTENAFVAEGWIPDAEYTPFKRAVQDAVGDHVDVEKLETAAYTRGGVHHESEGESEAVTDGGTAVGGDDPPVVQRNSGLVEPFEILVKAVGRPKYSEFDPTVVLFLTFPAFFGFMIGDLGYGLIYTAIGYYLYTNFDSPGFRSMGGVTIFAGLFTALFGVLYGEVFGLHVLGEVLFANGPPLRKGLQPGYINWAQGWLLVSVFAGIVHLNVGFAFDFVERYQLHDLREAVLESGSWILMLNGLWVWILSDQARTVKPGFIYTVFDTGDAAAIALNFGGFSAFVGAVGGGVFLLGLVLLGIGSTIELVEFLNVLVNALSYTRLAAVLLAKAGMAFTVNLLFFGVYQHDDKFHYMTSYGPGHVETEYGAEAIMFDGLVHLGWSGVVGGLVILVLGHVLVLALGVTSAGLQAVRLEYVEFFGKFYEGGGDEYEPFGYDRRFTGD